MLRVPKFLLYFKQGDFKTGYRIALSYCMKTSLHVIYFTFCFIIFSAALAQAQTGCPSTPDVTVIQSPESFKWAFLNISECEWRRQEIIIALPSLNGFMAMNKAINKMEEKRLELNDDRPFRIKIRDTDLSLYKVHLDRHSVSVVLVQDLSRIKAVDNVKLENGQNETSFNSIYIIQPASPGINFESASRKNKQLYIKLGASVGPAINFKRDDLSQGQMTPTFGVRTNLKLLINFQLN